MRVPSYGLGGGPPGGGCGGGGAGGTYGGEYGGAYGGGYGGGYSTGGVARSSPVLNRSKTARYVRYHAAREITEIAGATTPGRMNGRYPAGVVGVGTVATTTRFAAPPAPAATIPRTSAIIARARSRGVVRASMLHRRNRPTRRDPTMAPASPAAADQGDERGDREEESDDEDLDDEEDDHRDRDVPDALLRLARIPRVRVHPRHHRLRGHGTGRA